MSQAKLQLQIVFEDLLSQWIKKFLDDLTVNMFVATATVSERMRMAAMELGGTRRADAVRLLLEDR